MAQDTRGVDLLKQFLVEYAEGEEPTEIGNLGENEISGFDIFLIIVLSPSSEMTQINEQLDTLWDFRRKNWMLIYPKIHRKYIEEYLKKSYEINDWDFNVRYFSLKHENREQLKNFIADRLSIEPRFPLKRINSQPHPQIQIRPLSDIRRRLFDIIRRLPEFFYPKKIRLIFSIIFILFLVWFLIKFNIISFGELYIHVAFHDPSCPSNAAKIIGEGKSCLQRDEVIQIGGTLSLSGQLEEIGKDYHQGFNLCADEINAEGGLLGKPVVFLIEDDESDSALSQELYQKLITEDKVDLIIGPYSSSITAFASQVAAEHHYPMIAPGASSPTIWQQGNQYVFGVHAVAGADYLRGAVEIASQERLSKVAILAQSGKSFTGAILRSTRDLLLEYDDMEIVYQAVYEYEEDQNGEPSENTRLEIVSALQMAQKEGAEVLLGATFSHDAPLIVEEAKKLNFKPRMFAFTIAPALPQFTEKLGDDAEFIFGTSEWDASLNTPGAEKFVEAYQKRFAEEPSDHAASAYGACQLLQQAVQKVDSLNQELIRDELQLLETETVFGAYKVDDTGKQIGKQVYLIQVQNGKPALVWPFDLPAVTPYQLSEPVSELNILE